MSIAEQSLLNLAEYGQVVMCHIDPQGQILQANSAFLDLVGATQEDVQAGLSLRKFLDLPGRRHGVEQELLVGQWTITFERILLCRDNNLTPVLVEISPLKSAVECYLARIVDLAAYKRSQRDALQATAIIDSSDDAIISKDLEGIIVSWNTGAERLYGYRAHEVVGQSISLLIPPELADDFPNIMRRLQKGERLAHYETVRVKKDGTRVAVSATISPIRESSGVIIGAASVARDITDRKQMEDMINKNQELMQQYRRAQEVNRLKSEFLANMSHELRTPLNAIIGFTELLFDEVPGPLLEEQKDYLGDVLGSSRHLLRLITDVLDLAKIEAGKMTFQPEPVDLDELVGEVCNILRPLTIDNHLQLEVEIDSRLGGVTVDAAKLKQVLYNYLSNAIKFTPLEGQITLRLRVEGEDAFRLEVQDSGIGIKPEDVGRLFVEFQQLDGSLNKQYQGTGLGLALTRRIVEAQGGQVGVQSTPGHGSTFFATLPRFATVTQQGQQEEMAAPLLVLPEPPNAPSALIVEDEPKDRRALIQAFTDAGYHVEVASTGAQAVAHCRQRSFDVITLDLLLPDLSGWEVLRAIRGEELNREAPVIVVTLITEKEIGLGFPIQAILKKPLQVEDLLVSLERVKLEQARTDSDQQQSRLAHMS